MSLFAKSGSLYNEPIQAWDAERVNEKRGYATSEPEDFLKFTERMNSWALMVALIGEGQEIHLGEESGLPQWNDALSVIEETVDSLLPGEDRGLFNCAREG